MSKREELLSKLEKGVSTDEASSLLKEIQKQEALEKAPKKNRLHLKTAREQRFSDLWFSQRETATIEEKNRVGLAYISKVLGLGDEIAQKFAKGDSEAFHSIGMKQANAPGTDLLGFWQEVKEIFPDIYTDEDINFLVKQGGVVAVFYFLWQLEVPQAEQSPILRALATNAHVYK